MTLAIGIHCNHDASVVLCSEHNVIVSIAEERLSGIKHYTGFPHRALKRVVQYAGITEKDVDILAFSGANLFIPEHRESWIVDLTGTRKVPDECSRKAQSELITKGYAYPSICSGPFSGRHWSRHIGLLQKLGLMRPSVKHYSVAHHRAHASAAFRLSSCDIACVLTLDGVGEGVSGTIYRGEPDGTLSLMRMSASKHSLGA